MNFICDIYINMKKKKQIIFNQLCFFCFVQLCQLGKSASVLELRTELLALLKPIEKFTDIVYVDGKIGWAVFPSP